MKTWKPINTAPKDGTEILVLCIESQKFFPARWNPDGDSWVDENDNINGSAHHLKVTGVWSSMGGWFQPNEVSHWLPITN